MTYMYDHKSGEIIDSDDGQLIATTSASATPEQGMLMAAAPQMLGALLAVTEYFGGGDFDNGLDELMTQVHDAIEGAKWGTT